MSEFSEITKQLNEIEAEHFELNVTQSECLKSKIFIPLLISADKKNIIEVLETSNPYDASNTLLTNAEEQREVFI